MSNVDITSDKNSFDNEYLHKNKIWSGSWEYIKDYNSIVVNIQSNEKSNDEGIIIEFSSTISDRDITDSLYYSYKEINKLLVLKFQKKNIWFRIKYINGELGAYATLSCIFSTLEVNENGTLLLQSNHDAYSFVIFDLCYLTYIKYYIQPNLMNHIHFYFHLLFWQLKL